MSDEVLDELKRILSEELDVPLAAGEIDETASLFEKGLALDSYVVAELIRAVEDRFGIELEDTDLSVEAFESLQVLARRIGEKIHHGGGPVEPP